jgi:lysophospholipase L1-like esterase
MIDCMIIGDSIAVGTAQVRQECTSLSTSGLNSKQWNKKYKDQNLQAPSVIISLGTNDHRGVNTFKELMNLRTRVDARHVYWIMPPCNDQFCKADVNDIVEIIARNFGDTMITTKRVQKDAVHPSWAGYKELANQTR